METLKEYLQSLHAPQTVASYLYSINNFLAVNPKAKTYGYKELVNYLESLTNDYINDKTRSTQLASIKKYYDYLLETKQREDHPCRALYIRSQKNSLEHQSLFSSEELELLLTRKNRYKLLDSRNKVLIMLLIYQGLRSEELCNIRLEDIDLENGFIFIRSTHFTSRRTLELKPKQILIMSSYISHSREELIKGNYKQLLITKKGIPISVETVERIIRPLKGLFLGKSLCPKTIRQSVISNWLNEKKYTLGDVQLLAGHKYPSSTEKYKREDNENKRKLINQYHPLG